MSKHDKRNRSHAPENERIAARLHRDLVDTFDEEIESEVDDLVGASVTESAGAQSQSS